MKKKGILVGLIGIFGLNFIFANQFPVEPVNNGLAKKTIEWIFTDSGLQKNTTLEDRIEAAKAANRMSEIIVESIKALGIHKDGFLTESEMLKLNDYIYQNYHDEMVALHGDDEKDYETAFHRVVNDGATMKWYIPLKRKYKPVNRIADGIFHLGLFKAVNKHKILNEDGNKNVRWRLISRGLSTYLKKDLGILHWSPKAYYKSRIKKLKIEKQQVIAMLKKERDKFLAKAKDRDEYRAIKAKYRTLIRKTKNKYEALITEIRKKMRTIK